MEWKKLSYESMKGWKVNLPASGMGESVTEFRNGDTEANVTELLAFLHDLYGTSYQDDLLQPANHEITRGNLYTSVRVTNLKDRNLSILIEDLPWDFVLQCREKDFDFEGAEEINLLRDVVLEISKKPWSALGELHNKLIEYQQLLQLTGYLNEANGRLDKATYKAHEKFMVTGLNHKLGLSTNEEIHGTDDRKKYIIVWIQDALVLPYSYRYDLATWYAMKEEKEKDGESQILPTPSATPEKLIEFFIPWKKLGLDSESKELFKEHLFGRLHAFSLEPGTSAREGAFLASEYALKELEKLQRDQFLKELEEFNNMVAETREQREAIELRAKEIFKKVLSNPMLYADESILGKTATAIIYALRPQSEEELLWEYVIAAATAGLGVIIKTALAARRAKKVIKLYKIGSTRGARATGVIMRAGRRLENFNVVKRLADGEILIDASKGKRGFDAITFTGKGRKAKLFIDEFKNFGQKFVRGATKGKKKIPASRLKTLLKPSEYKLAVKNTKTKLKQLLSSGAIDDDTYGVLFKKLNNKDFTIRLVPGPDAEFAPEVIKEVQKSFGKAKVVVDKTFLE